MRVPGYLGLACIAGVACTAQTTDVHLSGSSSGSPSAVTPPGGSSGGTAMTDGGVTADDGPVPDEASAESAADSPAPVLVGDGGAPCETVMDSYGFARCVCSPGPSFPAEAGVASCMNYDCCVSYGADSGVELGFAEPAMTSGLCACFTSADIAAVSGVSTTCNDFVNHGGGVGKVVPSCP
jgi:hypothetical protein